MTIIENKTFDEERAFYASENIAALSCNFDGPADGESAFKECRNIKIKDCHFNLRYPFWHDKGTQIENSVLTENCRAALWYSSDISIKSSKLHGIKALRECENAKLADCSIISPEFGWLSKNVIAENCSVQGEYFMFNSSSLNFSSVELKGKYSFQYIKDSVFENCNFDTKDAFWHAKNVTVKNSTIKGEYLAWYCENVTFINCTIIGTQPLCYCKNLKLIDCKMIDCDLSFEKSQVEATLTDYVESIKNPSEGKIILPSAGEIIMDSDTYKAEIILTDKR